MPNQALHQTGRRAAALVAGNAGGRLVGIGVGRAGVRSLKIKLDKKKSLQIEGIIKQ
jgi:hypothetical protein